MTEQQTALARSNGTGLSLAAAGELADTQQLGKLLAQSGFFADAKEMSQAVVKVLAGKELGIAAIASMTGIFIVKGKITLSANLMAAVVKRSRRYDYRIKRLDDKNCTLFFYEKAIDGSKFELIGESEFTWEQATAANLPNSNPTWKAYPRNMLFARAMSNGAKWYCPDLWGGPIYTPEELGADEQMDDEMPAVRIETVTQPDAADATPVPLTPRAAQILTAIDRAVPVGGHAPKAEPVQQQTPKRPPPTDAEVRARVDVLIDKASVLGLAVPEIPANPTRQQLRDIGIELHEAVVRKEAEMDEAFDATDAKAAAEREA